MAPALLLDFDGTLCASLDALRAAYHGFLAGHGRTGSDREFDRMNGPPLAIIARLLARRHGLTEPPEILLGRYRALARRAQDGARPAAGAGRLLAAARGRYAVAVVTSADGPTVAAWLARHALAVDLVVGGGETTAGKPDPAPYRLALARLGADAATSLAVEDSVQGARSALGAGVATAYLGRVLPAGLAGHPLIRGPVDGLDAVIPLL